LDFFINYETKIVKTSADVQRVPIYYYKPSKKYSPAETIPLMLFPFYSMGKKMTTENVLHTRGWPRNRK